jgi:hypothetical protein
VNATPDNALEPLGFAMVNVSDVEAPTTTFEAPNDLLIVGGTTAPPAVTVTLADAVPPEPPSIELTALVVLFIVPAVVAVTFTLNVHAALDASVAPVRPTLPEPAVAVIVPPPQLPVSPLGVATTRPAGNVSVNATPDRLLDPLGLVMVKLSEVDAPRAMLEPPNDLAMVGGAVLAAVTAWNVSGDAVMFNDPAVVATDPCGENGVTVSGPIDVARLYVAKAGFPKSSQSIEPAVRSRPIAPPAAAGLPKINSPSVTVPAPTPLMLNVTLVSALVHIVGAVPQLAGLDIVEVSPVAVIVVCALVKGVPAKVPDVRPLNVYVIGAATTAVVTKNTERTAANNRFRNGIFSISF